MEDEKQNKVIVCASGGTIWHPDAKDPGLSEEEWNFTSKYIFILSMDENGGVFGF
jgi:hypothetical protein